MPPQQAERLLDLVNDGFNFGSHMGFRMFGQVRAQTIAMRGEWSKPDQHSIAAMITARLQGI